MSNIMVKNVTFGKDEHIPTMVTRERVKACVWAGIPHKHIADMINISSPTLYKYYKKELDNTQHEYIAGLSQTALGLALNGNVPLIQFILKTKGAQYGWQEKQVVEHGISKELESLGERMIELERDNERAY